MKYLTVLPFWLGLLFCVACVVAVGLAMLWLAPGARPGVRQSDGYCGPQTASQRSRRLYGFRFWRKSFWARLFRTRKWVAHERQLNEVLDSLLARGLIEPHGKGFRATEAAMAMGAAALAARAN